jgi:predicted nucleic acid-binding protein
MTVVDSSGWIEFLHGTERARLYEPALRSLEKVVVPSLAIFEVHRLIAAKRGDAVADAATSVMRKCRIAVLDATLAIRASKLSRQYKLAMADAVIYATAQEWGADLWTQDAHFKDLPGVEYFPKSKPNGKPT